jgi:hypothetical protein
LRAAAPNSSVSMPMPVRRCRCDPARRCSLLLLLLLLERIQLRPLTRQYRRIHRLDRR